MQLRLQSILRPVLLLSLLISVLSSAVPLSSATGSHLCTMACCAAKPPHEAGTCIMLACEIKPSSSRKQKRKTGDPMCGSNMPSADRSDIQMAEMATEQSPSSDRLSIAEFDFSHTDSSQEGESGSPSIAAAAFTTPCPPDCGGATCSFTTQNRTRHLAALGFAARPRPPALIQKLRSSNRRSFAVAILCRKSSPRGPPTFSS